MSATVGVPVTVDAPTVVAAWAIVLGALRRSGTVRPAVTVDGTHRVIEADLDALGTGADLVAACAAGGTDAVDAADDVALVIEQGRVGLSAGSVGPVQAALLAGLVARTAERIAADPSVPLTRLRAFSGEDTGPPEVWRRAAGQAADTPSPRHEIVREWARREPDRLAAVHGSHRLTYGDLDKRADTLADRLVAYGVGPDVAVAVCLPPGFDLVVAQLAVLRAGGCYLPVDPGYPAARIAFLLDDADARVVLATPDATVPADRPVIRLGPEPIAAGPADRAVTHPGPDAGAGGSALAPERAVAEARLGYLLYTSGSVGEPKCVAVPEAAVGRLLDAVGRLVRVRPGDAVLVSSSAAFDISTVEIYLPLLNGGHLVIADRDQVRAPDELARLIDRHRVRLVQATPSAWWALAEALAPGGRREWLQVVAAGEPLTPALAGRLLAVAGRVFNGYGPTETTIYSTVAEITTADEVTVGEPVDGTVLHVVDEHDRPLPAGVPGELLIGGTNVARGYLRRPELTADRFVPDRWGHEATPSTVYRTGDLAWWAPDGRLRLLGRIDAQVKVRGYRIEPGEVEARLNEHPDIVASVVRAREFGPGDTRLVAFVVTAGDKPMPLGELREWCAVTLPGHLVPTVCLRLPALPLTGSGKIDDRSLPGPAEILAWPPDDAASATSDLTRPRTAAERAVARIWQKALWADDLDVHDDFFALGGDSLLATQVTRELQSEFLLTVPIQAIFRFPTVARLAAAIVDGRAAGEVDVSVRAEPSEARRG
ncbi:amino acid adenylation domain-containing protein [Micromonospora sp. NPDC049175]|uniref:non-ribosomal peptide synthetase n=1 Tax=Micromonospora sp. NPDC049175 TaxID=3364266 RepID=UPI003720A222